MPTKVVVIGAGWFGLLAAKTYLQVDGSIDLVILEADETLGGTWSQTRIYPNLQAQQPWGVYEYADMSLEPPAGVPKTSFIPATELNAYMTAYAKKYSLLERMQFNTEVIGISRKAGSQQWLLNIKGHESEPPMVCDKVIVATGLTSKPNIPDVPTSQDFSPPIYHTRELGKQYESLASTRVQNVTVYGGGKSAIDCIHFCVSKGKHVNWVIRPKPGHGCPGLLPGMVAGNNVSDFVSSRFSLKLYPSLHSVGDWWYYILHSGKSALGSWFHWKYIGFLSSFMLSFAGYNKSENMAKLKPELMDHSLFWVNVPTAIITKPEIYDWIHEAKSIKVFRNSIVELSAPGSVVLDNGEQLPTDAVIWATGYNAHSSAFPGGEGASLGMASLVDQYPQTLREKWDRLESEADKKVIELFPRLGDPPPVPIRKEEAAPYRLYRHILPPALAEKDDRSLVFVGAVGPAVTAVVSEVTALWAAAWLSGNLDLKSRINQEDLEWDIAMNNAFSRRRYLNVSVGTARTYHLYEYLPLVDSMLEELGLSGRRKESFFSDLFSPYVPKDYRGLVKEWMNIRGVSGG